MIMSNIIDTAIKQCQARYTKMRYTPTVGEQTVLNRTLERSVKIVDKGYYVSVQLKGKGDDS